MMRAHLKRNGAVAGLGAALVIGCAVGTEPQSWEELAAEDGSLEFGEELGQKTQASTQDPEWSTFGPGSFLDEMGYEPQAGADPQVIGGDDASLGQFPWQVSLGELGDATSLNDVVYPHLRRFCDFHESRGDGRSLRVWHRCRAIGCSNRRHSTLRCAGLERPVPRRVEHHDPPELHNKCLLAKRRRYRHLGTERAATNQRGSSTYFHGEDIPLPGWGRRGLWLGTNKRKHRAWFGHLATRRPANLGQPSLQRRVHVHDRSGQQQDAVRRP